MSTVRDRLLRRSFGTHDFGVNKIQRAQLIKPGVGIVWRYFASLQRNADLRDLMLKQSSAKAQKAERGKLKWLADMLVRYVQRVFSRGHS